jgi:hypothetical protein
MEKIKTLKLSGKVKIIALLVILSVGALVSAGAYLVLHKSGETVKKEVLLAANLATADGTLSLKRDGDDRWSQALMGDVLEQGDSLKSGSNSRGVLELDNGDAIRLNADSEIKLVSLDPQEVVIEQVQGESYCRVAKSNSSTFTVKGQGVEAQALGTAYSFSNDLVNKNVGVYVYESKVKLTFNGEVKEVLELGKAVVNTGEKKVDVAEMSEEEYKATFIEWNKEQDKKLGTPSNEKNPPVVTITSPENGTKTQDAQVSLQGKVTDDNKLRKIIVNGTIYMTKDDGGKGFDPADGTFNITVDLQPGDNVFTIVAYDWYWNASTEATVSITRDTPVDPTPQPTQAFYISSISSPAAGKISLKWVLTNLDAPNGFKVVKADHVNPVYPGDDFQYLDNSGTRSYTWTGVSGGTYHVRVCIYNGNGACLRYTGDKTVTVQDGGSGEYPTAINISVSNPVDDGGTYHVEVSWSPVGNEAPNGYKVCWSESANPTYGVTGTTCQYQDSSARSLSVDGLESGKTYHFRVGAFKIEGDGCQLYSADVSKIMP